MSIIDKNDPDQHEADPKFNEYMLTLERLPSEKLENYNRKEKYNILKDYGSHLRSDLIEWIKEKGIADEVTEVGEVTAFNLLFVQGTENASKVLRDAPGVVDVVLAEDIPIELY